MILMLSLSCYFSALVSSGPATPLSCCYACRQGAAVAPSGTYLFTLSCVLLYVVENNTGYIEAVQHWKQNGGRGRRPW